MLGGIFTRLDLVTREEFEVQQEVLKRTREKLTGLETRVAALELGYKIREPDQTGCSRRKRWMICRKRNNAEIRG